MESFAVGHSNPVDDAGGTGSAQQRPSRCAGSWETHGPSGTVHEPDTRNPAAEYRRPSLDVSLQCWLTERTDGNAPTSWRPNAGSAQTRAAHEGLRYFACFSHTTTYGPPDAWVATRLPPPIMLRGTLARVARAPDVQQQHDGLGRVSAGIGAVLDQRHLVGLPGAEAGERLLSVDIDAVDDDGQGGGTRIAPMGAWATSQRSAERNRSSSFEVSRSRARPPESARAEVLEGLLLGSGRPSPVGLVDADGQAPLASPFLRPRP